MEDNHFIKEYYYYLAVFLCILIVLSLSSYLRNRFWKRFVDIFIFSFSLFTVYFIGSREVNIGVDTRRYEQTFLLYKNSESFFLRKDFFFDFLNYSFSRLFDFQLFLLFCAFIYVFGALYGLRKIFKENYYLPFLIFLISPYFINMGINVMRSGVAASLFIIGISLYYNGGKKRNVMFWFLSSVLFHISMFVPMFFILFTRYFKNTKIILLLWFGGIVLGVLNINIINNLADKLVLFTDRIANYADNVSENSSWDNFVIFGFFPVAFGLYNIIFLKYKNLFYKWLVNTYMLTHIPYIILINTERASRLGYLAEFMMPILLLFPLLIEPKIKIKYLRFKLCILIFIIFMIKAYKILIV